MPDVRVVSRASLEGIFADWVYFGSQISHIETTVRPFAWRYFGTKFFGTRYFGPKHFCPPFRKDTLVKRSIKVGQLDESEELATAIIVALLTDRRAAEGDLLPDPDETDHRGWWGDTEAEEIWDGWAIGCKNWLMARAKITGVGSSEGSTVSRIEDYTRTALRPFVEKKICSRIDVSAERVGLDRIDALVTIYRGPLDEIQLRFQDMWTSIRDE